MKGITIITPTFKEFKNGRYKVMTGHAKGKRTYGNYIMKNK